MEKTIAYLRDHRNEHLNWIKDLCRVPSISTQTEHKADIRAALEWLRDLCARHGFQTRIHETTGHPLLYAEWSQAPGAPTCLVYGHLDVQPAGDLDLWDADPFDPLVKGEWLICRGAADNKGPLLAHVRAAIAWLATAQRLPINLKFLIEAEEEVASPNLGPFVEQNKELLSCDYILISDTGMYADGWPTITYGTRGIVYKEIRLTGPTHDVHSGSFGGSIANPANELARIIASLHDGDAHINIPGFHDQVVDPSPAERELMASLEFDERKYLAELGSPAVFGETGYATYERRAYRPTLDVNGIYGGYMAAGASTIVPARAGAKISMRLVPNQASAEIDRLFEQTVRQRCPKTVRLEILDHGSCDPYVAPLDAPAMQAAKRALAEAFDHDVAFIREGGSLPILPMFKQVLGVDSVLMGLASPNCNAHGPNEKVRLPDLDRGAEAIARLLAYLGR
jgi:acetylornithine deacetylase/succinyl-diaminopimelate desuccinylase-like protein